jgi:UDP-N-acetylmuramoyl-tripeptide--D-alanyl-D-alanine ligase
MMPEALESFVPENNRSQIVSKGTNQIILDAYNANPSSMAVALRIFTTRAPAKNNSFRRYV